MESRRHAVERRRPTCDRRQDSLISKSAARGTASFRFVTSGCTWILTLAQDVTRLACTVIHGLFGHW
jgi:hypothetical protein